MEKEKHKEGFRILIREPSSIEQNTYFYECFKDGLIYEYKVDLFPDSAGFPQILIKTYELSVGMRMR